MLLALYCLMSPRLRYILFLLFFFFFFFFFFFAFPYLCMHSCPFFIVFFLYAYLPFFSYFDLLSLSLSRAISVYHPMSEEAPVTIGTPIEGFFDGADVVA